MKIAVLEHFTSCRPDRATRRLRAEGRAMREAVVEDLCRLPDVMVTVLLRDRGALPECPRRLNLLVEGDRRRLFRQAVRWSDAVLLIAPEQDCRLERLSRIVEEENRLLIGPSSRAVRLMADKLLTARCLAAAGVSTPRCEIVSFRRAERLLARRTPPFVLKPRDGCGGEGVVLVRRRGQIAAAMRAVRRATRRTDLLIQDYQPGVDASVSVLAGAARLLPMGLSRQRLARRGALRYEGGETPWPHPRGRQALRLACDAVEAVAERAPGVRGYLGVDLVLGADGPSIIEINPRLTVSYLGLRRVVSFNLPRAILEAARGGPVPDRVETLGRCRFRADGTAELLARRGGSLRSWFTSAGTSAASI